jgi:hypothetical protein
MGQRDGMGSVSGLCTRRVLGITSNGSSGEQVARGTTGVSLHPVMQRFSCERVAWSIVTEISHHYFSLQIDHCSC